MNKIKKLDILEAIDTSLATLYQGRLVTNAKYVDDILVCSHCGATTSHFKFKIHELLDSTEINIKILHHLILISTSSLRVSKYLSSDMLLLESLYPL